MCRYIRYAGRISLEEMTSVLEYTVQCGIIPVSHLAMMWLSAARIQGGLVYYSLRNSYEGDSFVTSI